MLILVARHVSNKDALMTLLSNGEEGGWVGELWPCAIADKSCVGDDCIRWRDDVPDGLEVSEYLGAGASVDAIADTASIER